MRSRSRFVLALQIFALFVAALAFGAVPGQALPAGGDHATVKTTNYTRYESWVDISWKYFAQGWHIEKAFCLKPKESYTYRVSYNHPSLQPQVRVRAEIKLAGCAKGTHAVVSGSGAVEKGHEYFDARIYEHTPNHFTLIFPR